MRADFRLARMLHVLSHIHGRTNTTSSEELAVMLNTNPVLVRRMMGGLRAAGYVTSTSGRNGGWVLAVDPDAITVRECRSSRLPAGTSNQRGA
jgi:DNA-binding IscR family transcriptional regulator